MQLALLFIQPKAAQLSMASQTLAHALGHEAVIVAGTVIVPH
jgi:hypothetical protein